MWRSPAPVSSVTGGSWCLSRVAGVLGDGGEWVRAGQRPLGSPIPLAAERPARDPARGVVGEGGRQPTGGVRGARGGGGEGSGGGGQRPRRPLCAPLRLRRCPRPPGRGVCPCACARRGYSLPSRLFTASFFKPSLRAQVPPRSSTLPGKRRPRGAVNV